MTARRNVLSLLRPFLVFVFSCHSRWFCNLPWDLLVSVIAELGFRCYLKLKPCSTALIFQDSTIGSHKKNFPFCFQARFVFISSEIAGPSLAQVNATDIAVHSLPHSSHSVSFSGFSVGTVIKMQRPTLLTEKPLTTLPNLVSHRSSTYLLCLYGCRWGDSNEDTMPMFISVIGLLEFQIGAFIYYHTVNGDSIPYEVLFYLFLFFLYHWSRINRRNHFSESQAWVTGFHVHPHCGDIISQWLQWLRRPFIFAAAPLMRNRNLC